MHFLGALAKRGASNSLILPEGGMGSNRGRPQLFLAIESLHLWNPWVFWILLDSWNLLEYIGFFWNLLESLESFGIFWNLLESFGIFWNLLKSFYSLGKFQNHFNSFRNFSIFLELLILLETFGFFWNLLESFGIFWGCFCKLPLQTLLPGFSIFGLYILSIFRNSWSDLEDLDSSYLNFFEHAARL